jgi:hypothetical protein
MPSLDAHKEEHNQLIRDLYAFESEFFSFSNPNFELEEWMRTRLVPHILEQDLEAV